jgi:hypothetical protein
MRPRKDDPEAKGWQWPGGAGPPVWLLPAGCAAVGLLLAGIVVGGETGEGLAGLGCLVLPSLAGIFVAVLAWRVMSDGRDGPGAGPPP